MMRSKALNILALNWHSTTYIGTAPENTLFTWTYLRPTRHIFIVGEGTYRFNTEARFDDMNWKSETAEKVIGYSTIELFVYVNRKSKKITKIEPAVKEEHRVIYAS